MKKVIFSSLLGAMIALSCTAQEPTRWRGPNLNGIYPESGLMDSWPASGPEIIWSFEELGQGHSSAAADNSNIYTAGMIDETGYLFKFDLTGRLLNKYAYGPEYTQSFYGTRGTPVIVGDLAYIVSGFGKLVCMDHSTGKTIWSKDMVKDFGGEVIKWGYNETPVVDGDKLYCTPGGKTDNVVALDRHSGELIWSCKGKGELSAYCTPLLFEHNGRKILATHTASHLLGIDAETGKLLWSHSQPNKWSVHANTPIYSGGELLYFSGYGQGGGVLKLDQNGESVSEVWFSKDFDSRIGGAVLVDGYIYGSGDNSRTWKAVDWKTGKAKYESSEIAKGTLIFADGKLYCYSEKGELALVKADPEKFELAGNTKVTLGSEQHWAHPMISNGVLYIRHGKALVAYKIK